RLFSRSRHGGRSTIRGHLFPGSVGVERAGPSRDTFSTNDYENSGVVWLFAPTIRFAVFDPKIRPVILNAQTEASVADAGLPAEMVRYFKRKSLLSECNRQTALVPVLWRFQANLCPRAAALNNPADLFFRCFAERKDGFFQINRRTIRL